VSRHPAERGPDIHPLMREWQKEEVSENFQSDDCIATVRPAYQGLITQLDDHLGRVWEAMTRLGRWQDTLVVFCSDHGDYLGDHWLGEKELFHDCIQRIPFLLYDPSAEADATRGTAGAWRDAVVSELDWTFRGARRRLGLPTGHHHAWMLRDARWKYVHWTSGYRPQLFDLRTDPEEFFDLGADPALEAVRAAMRERLLDWFTGLKRRTTLTWAEAELRTDRHKAAGVFLGEW
jgi:arylsulfatase A-like enzyme